MNAPIKTAAFPHLLPAHTVSAWRTAHGSTQAYPLETSADNLVDAVNELAPLCCHKDTLAVLVRDARKGGLLTIYSIKQESRVSYVRNASTGLTDAVKRLYPAEVSTMRVDAFEPTRPFDALTDHPVLTDAALVDAPKIQSHD